MSEEGFEQGHPGPEWLSAWHDGELQAPASSAVQTHVESCPTCRLALEEFRRLDEAVRMGDDARPEADAWPGITERLRLRLEDELSLGIPTGPATPYVVTGEDLVLLPTPAQIQAGRAARPFRLRWALATAAGLTVALVSLRMISDRDWTVGNVINPAPVQLSKGPAAGRPPATPPEAELAAADEALGKLEVIIAPRDYVAEVDRAIRRESTLGAARPAVPSGASSDEERSRDVQEMKSNAAGKKEAQPITDPDYAMVFAAASRAREAGNQPLARRGFELVRTGIPDDDLAREAEYQEILAAARVEMAAGGDPTVVSQRLIHDAAASWEALVPDQKLSCRKALADLRVAMTLAGELGQPLPLGDVDARLQRLRSCAR